MIDKIRYQRQLLLEEFGEEAQLKLQKSTVFIVGAGGLGSPAALYLAAAGIGKLIICDKDEVDLSNLNRQILHSTDDIGVAKTESALETLEKLNPDVKIETHLVKLDSSNLNELAFGTDLIVDCLDNVETRLILNNYSFSHQIPIIHAGIDSWYGHLTLINPPDTPCLMCLYESYEESGKPKPVLGAVAGIMGTMQALSAIKFLVGLETNIKNKILHFDGLNSEWTALPVQKNKDCMICAKR